MAVYEVEAPDGSVYEIEGPDDADPSAVIAQITGGQKNDPSVSSRARAENPATFDPGYQYSPTSGMGGFQRFFAGAGKAMADLGRGVRQLSAEATGVGGDRLRTQYDQQRVQDSPLMQSGAAKAGNVVGGIATAAPAMFVPGANTVAGAGLVGGVYGALQPVGTEDSRTMNAAVGGATGAAAQYLGGKVSNWASKKLSQRAAKAASEQSQNAVRDAALKEAQKAGYVVPPSTTNPTATNRMIEGVAGKAATQQAASVKNQKVTNALVRKSLGLGTDAPLTKETLNAVRSKAGGVYKAIQSAGDIVADSQYVDDLAAIAQSIDDVAKDFPDLNLNNNEQISALVDGLMQDKFSTKSAIELTKQLRKSASGNLSGINAADPAKRALGYAQRDAAAAVEDQMIRHLEASGKKPLADAFDGARKLIAKTYSVESALNESTGNVVATQLGAQLKRGKPLSGELELVAKFARSFDKAAQEIKTSPGVSALDAMFATVGAVGGATVNPAFVALPAARIGTRAAITSPFLNSRLATPNYAPGKSGQMLLRSAQGAKAAAVPSIVYATQE